MIQNYEEQFETVPAVFQAAVHRTAAAHDTPEQIDAWAQRPVDLARS